MTDPRGGSGASATAIAVAEASLAWQHSTAAAVDLQVISAILNAHTVHADSTACLARLQSEVESAVTTRPDLDSPAGARAFQYYLVGKLRDIRAVIETAELDATSKAALSAALATLYAGATPDDRADSVDAPRDERTPDPEPAIDLGFGRPPDDSAADTAPNAVPQAPSPAAAGAAAPFPSFGGFTPPGLSAGSDLPVGSVAPTFDGSPDPLPHHGVHPPDDLPPESDGGAATEDAADGVAGTDPEAQSARVITAAVSGTPIAEAFAQQGITIPPPGSPVSAPIEPATLQPGDVGILGDRYALALGNGKALCDDQIQAVTAVTGPGFRGWWRAAELQHTQ